MTDFRRLTREWIAANLPASMTTPMPEAEMPWGGRRQQWPNADSKIWMERMIDKNWIAPSWPSEFGGGGLTAQEAAIVAEELLASNARVPLFSFGLWMLGPVLLEYASEEQKGRFLPPIARGEIRWCQGYSEPGAGSDLASLRLKADDEGDHWLLNGQKVWTTYADKSDWIFCLVRTDAQAPKHRGISFMLVDLERAGITTRPIALISGQSPFCETFFDNVRVPKEDLIGPLNGGWGIAKKLLQYERQNVSAAGFGGDRSITIADLAKRVIGVDDAGRIADAGLRERIARHAMMEETVDIATRRSQIEVDAGKAGATSSVIKYASARANQNRHELAIEVLGMDAMGWSGEAFASGDLYETRKWLRSKGNSIEGGTSEINLNVLAKNVLGLPDA